MYHRYNYQPPADTFLIFFFNQISRLCQPFQPFSLSYSAVSQQYCQNDIITDRFLCNCFILQTTFCIPCKRWEIFEPIEILNCKYIWIIFKLFVAISGSLLDRLESEQVEEYVERGHMMINPGFSRQIAQRPITRHIFGSRGSSIWFLL